MASNQNKATYTNELTKSILQIVEFRQNKYHFLPSKMEQVLSAVHRVTAIVEEQETRNKYVLDGHQNLHDRQDHFEKEIKSDVSDIKQIISKMNTYAGD